jgi:hypothetical protein
MAISGKLIRSLKMNNEVASEWLQETLRLPLGQKIYLPCIDKETQKRDYKDLVSSRRDIAKVDPVAASTLQIGKLAKSHNLWIVISHVSANPRIGFVEVSPGKMERIFLSLTKDFWRKITLMLEDGLAEEEIIELVQDELSLPQLEELLKWLNDPKDTESN